MTNRRRIFIAMLLLFISTTAALAQKTTGSFYIFKKDGNPTADMKEAAFLQHIFPLDDTTFISRYYNFAGPMVAQETYRDSNLTIPNGRFCWYNTSGKLDSTGIVIGGRKDGDWEYIVSKNETRNVTYENGKRVKERILYYDDNGKYIPADSSKKDDEEDPTQKEAVYKNGINDWIKYIQKNLHTPERLQNVLKDGQHTCAINFLIDKEGNTRAPYLSKSCEWSGDAEALRLIKDSPQWHPAIQKGKPVVYRQIQPITYAVSSQ